MISIVREISRHTGASVAEGVFRGDRVAVKSFSSDSAFNRERGALSAIGTTGAPVPTILWAGYHNDVPTIVQNWIDGAPGLPTFLAARGQDRLGLVHLAAATHARMCRAALGAASLDLSFIGAVNGAPTNQRDWPEVLAAQVEKWLSRLSAATLDRLGGSESANKLLGQALGAPRDFRTLVHCDYLFRNLIVCSAETAVVIDFGAALVGDPRYDLAKIIWRDLDGPGGDLATHFLQSWTDHSGIDVPADLLSLYVACHSLAALAWVEKQPSGTGSDARFRTLALETFLSVPKPWL